jgi:hypothetical protein
MPRQLQIRIKSRVARKRTVLRKTGSAGGSQGLLRCQCTSNAGILTHACDRKCDLIHISLCTSGYVIVAPAHLLWNSLPSLLPTATSIGSVGTRSTTPECSAQDRPGAGIIESAAEGRNLSTTRSARRCHPCLRCVLLPMSSGWTQDMWRRGRDSNPRYGCPYAAFRVRCFQPLSHLSDAL